jgi:hypothetical protein
MKRIAALILGVSFTFFGCSSPVEKNGADSEWQTTQSELSQSEINALVKRARLGDLFAYEVLSDHYALYGEVEAEDYWETQSRKIGAPWIFAGEFYENLEKAKNSKTPSAKRAFLLAADVARAKVQKKIQFLRPNARKWFESSLLEFAQMKKENSLQ